LIIKVSGQNQARRAEDNEEKCRQIKLANKYFVQQEDCHEDLNDDRRRGVE